MEWLDTSTENCSVQRTLDVIGEKWTLLVLREAFNGVRRFDDMRRHLRVSESVLADRLRTLVDAGVLDTAPYQAPGQRSRREYRLTAKGFDLYPILIALLQWGDRYCSRRTAGAARHRPRNGCAGRGGGASGRLRPRADRA